MDPYCLLEYNTKKYTTKVNKKGGMNPRWNEIFVVPVTGKPSKIRFSIYDSETYKKDDFLGEG
jgi:Ca2+-dependent lipid-binding protein